MMHRTFVAALVFLGLMAFAVAADFNGKWEGDAGPNGEYHLVFTFKVDGQKLTGSVESPMGSNDIENGLVEGDRLSFEINIGGGQISYAGKASSDSAIQLHVVGPWGESDMEITRAKQTSE